MTIWIFRAQDDDTIVRMPYTLYSRAVDGHERLASGGEREMKTIECILEVRYRRVTGVHRVLPARVPLTSDGWYDARLSGRQAMRRMELYGGLYRERGQPFDQIALLEADASHFWIPSPRQWQMLADATTLSLETLHAASFV